MIRFRVAAAGLVLALLPFTAPARPLAQQSPDATPTQPSDSQAAATQEASAQTADQQSGDQATAQEPAQAPEAGTGTAAAGREAQEPSAEDLGIFVDTVEVNVVNVEVFVTDKKGNRINGLTRDDFEVLEDRRPVEITNFYAVEDGRPVRGDLVDERPAPEGAVPGVPAPEPELPEDQRLNLVVYIDNFNLDPLNRNRVLRELRLFLSDKLEIGDRVMLVSYDRSLHVRRTFTTDPQVVATALAELETLTGFARQRESDRMQVLGRIQDARSAGEAMLMARSWADELDNDLRFTLDALKSMVSSLAGLPGRKAVLYVSDGVPMVAGQDIFHAVQEKFNETSAITESLGFTFARQFDELAAQANANRITFYTIDAAGLRVASDFSAQNRNAPISGVDSINTNNLQEPLRYVARETGGLAILNTNRVGPMLDRVAEDFDTYYSIGYRAPEAGRGRYHDIDVKVKGRRGLEIRHREGYRDKSHEARMSDATMSALHFELDRNPLEVELGFGAATPREDRFFIVPVEVRFPIGEIAMVPREATWEGRVRLFIAAIDEEGGTSPVQQVEVPVSIPNDQIELAREQRYQYSVNLMMRSGLHSVAVGLRDELGGEESFVTSQVRVGG
jgi:VWFA-related protein